MNGGTTKRARILEAIANGAETARDVEVDLDFTIGCHLIAGHLSNLLKEGKVIKLGEVRHVADGRGGARRAFRYGLPPARQDA